MTLRKPLLALFSSALCLLAFGAFGVSSAAASTTEECKIPEVGETFTSQHFLDSNCTESNTEGEYHTVAVKPNALLNRTNTSTITIHAEISSTPTAITCEALSGSKVVSNYEEIGGTGFKGEGKIKMSGCVASEPAGCIVKPIETVQLSESSEDLLGAIMRTLFAPKEGSKLATITLEGCAIAGSYPLEGKLRSQTVDIHTEEFSNTSGSELTVAKKPATLKASFHDATAANGKTVVRETP
ncbi:MAG TPA: hypothetical protein VFI17_07055 [Solirubrobacterales bacterium]|nr:hypothetical protein [Solirubrobacterales bacterium]